MGKIKTPALIENVFFPGVRGKKNPPGICFLSFPPKKKERKLIMSVNTQGFFSFSL
jgi:hypothetical protein